MEYYFGRNPFLSYLWTCTWLPCILYCESKCENKDLGSLIEKAYESYYTYISPHELVLRWANLAMLNLGLD